MRLCSPAPPATSCAHSPLTLVCITPSATRKKKHRFVLVLMYLRRLPLHTTPSTIVAAVANPIPPRAPCPCSPLPAPGPGNETNVSGSIHGTTRQVLPAAPVRPIQRPALRSRSPGPKTSHRRCEPGRGVQPRSRRPHPAGGLPASPSRVLRWVGRHGGGVGPQGR